MSFSPILALPILLPLALLQAVWFTYTPILGVPIQIVAVFVLAFALWRSSAEAILWAFIGGITLDLLSVAPIGTTTLALTIAILAIAPFRTNLQYSRVLYPLLLLAAAGLIFQLTNLLLLRLIGYPIATATVRFVPLTVIIHTLAALPIYWLLRLLDILTVNHVH